MTFKIIPAYFLVIMLNDVLNISHKCLLFDWWMICLCHCLHLHFSLLWQPLALKFARTPGIFNSFSKNYASFYVKPSLANLGYSHQKKMYCSGDHRFFEFLPHQNPVNEHWKKRTNKFWISSYPIITPVLARNIFH